MPEAFDAYYHWLGIPPGEQPPHYYRLLGLREFEPDLRAIAAAADRLTLHLRSYQTGPCYQLAGKLLMEVAAARSCLLDPPRRAVYDQQLQRALATRAGKGDSPHLCEAPGGPFRQMGTVPFSAGGGPCSPEHPLASPPPPGSGAPPSPIAGGYAQQPFAAPSAYSAATFAAPMAYPPTMSPAPTVYPSAPLAAPSGYPPSRPPAPAPYPGAAAAPSPYSAQMGTVPLSPPVPAALSTPPWTIEASEDDSELPSSGQSVRGVLRRTFRRRDEGSYYLIAGLVGLVSLVVIFGILLARHPLDDMFNAYREKPPAPQSPAFKPKPPAPPESTPKAPARRPAL